MRKNISLIMVSLILVSPLMAFAQNRNTTAKLISDKNEEIEILEQEIQQYQDQVNEISSQAQTLQSVLNTISANQKQLQAKIQLTNKKITQTNGIILKNEQKIRQLSRGIVSNTSAVAETIRSLNTLDRTSLFELIMSDEGLSDFMRTFVDLEKIQSTFKNQVTVMVDTKSSLEEAQKELATQTQQLKKLQNDLSDQERIVAIQKKEQDDLLRDTKNQESQYLALLQERRARKASLDAEIRNYESQLAFTIDTKTLPKPGSKVLGWPVSNPFITQRFGRTVDARRLYVSGSHSGVDFRAPVGTPIYAVADGVVEGIGDTDKTCYRASFGKWVFIRHYNGLATAYGHLSLIKASEGQPVVKGELIGYSGNTGHSTGPHLHLTVYAANGVDGSEGARIAERPSASCSGKNYRMPIAPTTAYLDPLLYLPALAANKFKDQSYE